MRKIVGLLLGCGLLFGLATGVMAYCEYPDYHPEAGQPIVVYAGAIPAGAITFDGNLSEWANMPDPYVWTLDTVPKTSERIRNGEIAKDDWDVIIYFGWIPDENMFCFAADVTDDVLYAPDANLWNTWKEDNLQISFDPDGDLVNYRQPPEDDSREGQQNFFTPDEGIFDLFITRIAGEGSASGISVDKALDWAYKEPYLFKGLQKGTGGSYTLEVAMALWDDLMPGTGPENSIRCMLEPNKVLPMGFYIGDKDTPDDAVGSGFHCTDPGAGDPSGFCECILMSLEDTGWGMPVGPEVTDLSVTPGEIEEGQTITIKATGKTQ